MRRVLFLTYTFPPDNAAAAMRPGQLYDFLPKYGYHPVVVANTLAPATAMADVIRVPDGSESRATRLLSAAAKVFMRVAAPYNDRLPWVPPAIRAGIEVLRTQQVSATYSTSPFLASHFAAYWLKRKFHLPWIADFQDPVTHNPFRNRRWIYPYDHMLEAMFFRNADHLLANTDTVAAAWKKKYPQYASKISVLWNSFDPRESIPSGLRIDRSDRVISHVGALYGGRHPEHLLFALSRIHGSLPNLRVELVGPIEQQILARLNSVFAPQSRAGTLVYNDALVSRAEALRETAEADYLLLLDMNEQNAAFQLPSKLVDYVRAGKPILAYTPKGSPVERVLQRSGIRFLAIDSATSSMNATDRQLTEFLGSRTGGGTPSAWFHENFSADRQASIVKQLLDKLVESRGGRNTPSSSQGDA